MIVLIHVTWLFVGASIAGALRDPVKSRVFNVALAIALVGFSVFALVPRVH